MSVAQHQNEKRTLPVRHHSTPRAATILKAAAFLATLTLLLTATTQAAPEITTDRGGTPTWQIDPQYLGEAFTFVRLRPRRHSAWRTDWPSADVNFPYRLHQLTTILVNPDPIVLEITDPALRDYPFVYTAEPKTLDLAPDEAEILRDYLLNGGFLLVDDFWGESEWATALENMRRIFPDREPVELTLDHPIFHSVFDLKKKPQIPAIEIAIEGRSQGITWEKDGQEPHYMAWFDDDGRLVALLCHNTDLGDGWEREGENEWFFHEFSEKQAYPMGINIVFYVLTH